MPAMGLSAGIFRFACRNKAIRQQGNKRECVNAVNALDGQRRIMESKGVKDIIFGAFSPSFRTPAGLAAF